MEVVAAVVVCARRGSRSRERIEKAWVRTGIGVGAGNWTGNGGDCRFQVPVPRCRCRRSDRHWVAHLLDRG